MQELHSISWRSTSHDDQIANLAGHTYRSLPSIAADTVQRQVVHLTCSKAQRTQNLASASVVQQPAAPAPAVNAGSGPETVSKYGATWTVNHPDAPNCPDGTKSVLKEWTAKSTGKATKAWKHKAWLDGTQSQLDPASKEFNQFVG